jgi:hypothetical protein
MKNWRKSSGNSQGWFHEDVQKLSNALQSVSKDDPSYPLELRSWKACGAFQRELGLVPPGIVDEEEVVLFVTSRMVTNDVPWSRFYFPCVYLSSVSSTQDKIPVPFQMCLLAQHWLKHQEKSDEDVEDWRRVKYRWVARTQPALRHLYTGKKRHLDKRFGLNYMASDHALGPIEGALMRWIYECGGPRLIIPPSFRDPVWALSEDKKDRVDAFTYLFPEINKEVETWAQTSGWTGLITPKEFLKLNL